MEKRYQVFVSSTYDDLRDERLEVIQALLELDCIPSGMELFPAADDDQWTLIKRVIDDCDYYVVIIAGRYGSIGPSGNSFTQMEYEHAISTGKPVIAFLHADPGKIQADKTDPQNQHKLQEFRGLARKKMCKNWTTAHELGSVVSRSIIKLIKEKPGIGWVRADLISDETAAREMLRLRSENDALKKKLERLGSEPPVGMGSFAWGEEQIDLHFSFTGLGNTIVRQSLSVSWNELFKVLAPLMIDGASELTLQIKLEELFVNRKLDESRETAYSANIRDEDFQKIKVQFRALGLIVLDDRNAPKQAEKPRWILTPYGDGLLSQMAAIRSNKSTFGSVE
jgi:hypothetical protein